MIEELSKFWNSEFIDFAPEAHNLKHVYKNRWVRFHSLPESKRYPENKNEYLEVFRRHNIILQEYCGKESELLLVLPEYSEASEPAKPIPKLSNLFPVSVPWCVLKQHEDDDAYEYYCHLHVSVVQYTGHELNDLFREIANDEVGNVMIIYPNKSLVFHPYDGGADVLLASTAERDKLKEKYIDWLSSHPEGF